MYEEDKFLWYSLFVLLNKYREYTYTLFLILDKLETLKDYPDIFKSPDIEDCEITTLIDKTITLVGTNMLPYAVITEDSYGYDYKNTFVYRYSKWVNDKCEYISELTSENTKRIIKERNIESFKVYYMLNVKHYIDIIMTMYKYEIEIPEKSSDRLDTIYENINELFNYYITNLKNIIKGDVNMNNTDKAIIVSDDFFSNKDRSWCTTLKDNKISREDTIVFGDKLVDKVIKDIILEQTKMEHSDEYLKSMIDEIKESIKNVCNKTVNEEYDYFVRTEFPNYNRNLEDQDIIISNKINVLVNERNIHTSILAKMLKVEESTIKHYLNYNKPVCSSLSGEVISEEQLFNDRNTLLSYI